MSMKMVFVGVDERDRPVYKDERGRYWKDMSLKGGTQTALYRTTGLDGRLAEPFRGTVRFVRKQ